MATMRKVIDIDGFEALFASDPDPWCYAHSSFERYKRAVLLRACGPRCYGRGLELGCANGETTAVLGERCLRLTAADGSPTALDVARRRNRGNDRIAFRQAVLPEEMPPGRFDLVVVSELLYYLPPEALRCCLLKLEHTVAPGGRIVLLHHIVPFDDAAILPVRAATIAQRFLSRRWRLRFHYRHSRYAALAFDAGTVRVRSQRGRGSWSSGGIAPCCSGR